MAASYGVFTIERQDLVDLSTRIAQCVPKDFLRDKGKPVLMAIDGSFRCGKKIFADYGRDGLLDIDGEKLNFSSEFSTNSVTIKRIKNLLITLGEKLGKDSRYKSLEDVIYHGEKEFDEYVRRVVDGKSLEVSFINLAWGGGYSFPIQLNELAKMEKHLEYRRNGGLAYVHNCSLDEFQPDIEIGLEANCDDTYVNGRKRRCPDVHEALARAIGKEKIDEHRNWARYVEVKINTPQIDRDKNFSKMLCEEFGFVSTDEIDESVMRSSSSVEEKTPQDVHFPIVKSHAFLAQKYQNVM